MQTGTAMLGALALGGQGWLNVQTSTVFGYAKSIWESSGGYPHRLLSSTGSMILTEKLIGDAAVPEDSPLRRSGRSVARAIGELRLAGVSQIEYEDVGESVLESQLGAVYQLYQDYLADRKLFDQAEVLLAANQLLENESFAAHPQIVMIMDDLVLTELELIFVRLLSKSANSSYRIGAPTDEADISAHTAASLVREWPIPASKSRSNSDACLGKDRRTNSVHVIRAVGVENEIRAVFREIIGKGLPLDAVELSYSTREPYVRVIESLSDRYGIDTTLSSGGVGTATRVRQAIKLFLSWIGEGQSSAILVQLLRAGYVFLEDPRGGDTRLSFRAANLMATVHLTGGAETYQRFFDRHQQKLEIELELAKGSRVEEDRSRSLETLRGISDSLAHLLSLGAVHSETTLHDLTGRIESFVRMYVLPEARIKILPVAATILDETEKLLFRLNRLSEEIQDRLPRTILLRQLLDFLEPRRLNSARSSSGSVRIVPLSEAGYSSRPHLFIVGLDELTMATRLSGNPFLSDEHKGRIEEETGHCIPRSTETDENRQRDLHKALSRTAGKVTFIYNCYDIGEGRELYPSSAIRTLAQCDEPRDILKKEAKTDSNDLSTKLHSYVPDAADSQIGLPLDWTDLVLATRDSSETIDICERKYPWIGRGRRALRERSLESWTPYDGQIHPGQRGKALFSGNTRWSASRLETLSACPFRYFLKHVLRARSLDEREDEAWMSPLEKGLLVHRVLAEFMSGRIGQISASDISELEEQLLLEVEEFSHTRTPPNPAVAEGIKLEVKAIAASFIYDQLNRQEYMEAFAFEFGFGVWPHHKKAESDQTEPVLVDIGGLTISLQGWIDRIDRLNSGGFAITDYKTGSSSRFSEADLLNGGKSLQWALYAFVVEDLLSEPVHLSGYLFPGVGEFGRRIEADPGKARQAVGEELERLGGLVNAGAFFQAANEQGECKYCDYKRVCGDLDQVKRSVHKKIEATDAAMVHHDLLSNWNYATKLLPKSS